MIPADLLEIATTEPAPGPGVWQPEATSVYFLIAGGKVVYVGHTTMPSLRVRNHRAVGRRFDLALFVSVGGTDGLAVERYWIKRLCPRHNRRCNPKPDPTAESWGFPLTKRGRKVGAK